MKLCEMINANKTINPRHFNNNNGFVAPLGPKIQRCWELSGRHLIWIQINLEIRIQIRYGCVVLFTG